MDILVSPTGGGIRGDDDFGSGAFLAKRTGRCHYGSDYECIPGRPVVAPCDGHVIRRKRPYADDPQWDGILIESPMGLQITLFYVAINPDLLGKEITQYQIIGTAQDLTPRYPGITPHVHMEVVWPKGRTLPMEWRINREYVVKGGSVYINPTLLIGG